MEKPWLRTPTEAIPQLPAMLGGEELQLLYWMGQENQGGAIIDLGAFLGGSAAALAAGASSVNASGPLFSYDLFTYGRWCEGFGMGGGWNDGDDTIPFVRGLTWPWRERITFIKGDISEQTWSGGIDALFVDFTQNWHHHNAVSKNFLAHLRLGGILAHQDYVYIVCYWLHVFMEHYADHFEKLSPLIMNGTAAWRYIRPLPQEAFDVGLNRQLTAGDMLYLIDRSLEHYSGVHKGLIQLARVRFFWHAFGRESAANELSLIEAEFGSHPDLAPLIDVTRANITRDTNPYPPGFFRTQYDTLQTGPQSLD